MVKKSLSLALALVLCLTLSAPALAAGPIFTDVPADHWAHEQIAKAYNIGIVSGTSYNEATGARTYSPNGTTTIAQLLVMVTRFAYPDEVDASTATGSWYAKNLEVAKAHKLTEGFADVDVNTAATREQLVTILWRVAGSPELTSVQQLSWLNRKAEFSDLSDTASYATVAIAWAVEYGIVSGTAVASIERPMVPLNPKGTATRAQVAVIMVRYLEEVEGIKIPTPDEMKPSDTNAKNPDGTTNADNVNLLSNVGKSADYPTSGKGSSDTMNENGYFTAADVDIENAKLRYEALEFINAYLESEGLKPAVWTTSDEMEEYCLMRAKEAAANFTHDRPDGSDSLLGENLAKGYGNAKNTMSGWVNSTLHASTLRGGSSTYEGQEVCVASYGDTWVYVHGNDKDLKDGAVPLISIASNNYYF